MFAFLFFVAVDRALGTSGFVLTVRAFGQTFPGVTHQRVAVVAKVTGHAAVVILAINCSHTHQCFMF